VAAQQDETVGLFAVAAPKNPGNGRLQVVIADPSRDTAQVLRGAYVPIQEGVLGLVEVDAVEAFSRSTKAHDEHPAGDRART
jgi:hypothetical protein